MFNFIGIFFKHTRQKQASKQPDIQSTSSFIFLQFKHSNLKAAQKRKLKLTLDLTPCVIATKPYSQPATFTQLKNSFIKSFFLPPLLFDQPNYAAFWCFGSCHVMPKNIYISSSKTTEKQTYLILLHTFSPH